MQALCFQMLMEAHQAWYHMQRCKDRFEGLLKIDQLRAGSPPATLPPDPPRLTTGRMSTGGKDAVVHCYCLHCYFIVSINALIYCIFIVSFCITVFVYCIARSMVSVYVAIVCKVMSAHNSRVVSITWCHRSQSSHLGFDLFPVTQAQSQGCTCLMSADFWLHAFHPDSMQTNKLEFTPACC